MKKTQRQCKLCPWKVTTDPRTIPDGYCEEKHRRLSRTIARTDVPPDLDALDAPLRLMACHESPIGRDRPCVGWLHNQLTDGDNVLLRYFVVLKRVSADYELDGPQRATFEETLPK